MGTVAKPRVPHRPRLVHRADGRFEISCAQCEAMAGETRPIGIGLPIASRFEAEAIMRNHSGRAA